MNSASNRYQPLNLDILNTIISESDTCILLDNARSSPKQRYSYFLLNPEKTLVAYNYSDVEKILCEIDSYIKSNWIFGYISYEASYVLEERFSDFRKLQPKDLPLIWFAVSNDPWIYDHAKGIWNKPLPKGDTPANDNNDKEKPEVTHMIEESVFKKKIAEIKEAIKNGETYQVNFTYDVELRSRLSPFSLYKHLRERQRTPYCGFLKNEFGYVASFSPELFFDKRGNKISVKPMKGTVHRGHSAEEDRALVRFLENDTKNRAENLMIVDLLRNDLGRVCEGGTVKTEKLFEVETHPTIQQMTSTINGLLKPQIKIRDLIKSIFPCGSVTGAPKIRTMEIIHELEAGQRGVYCGAFGYISPKGKATFNVPIRTLQKNNYDTAWRYRVGSGIVWDSDAEGEWKECAQKCSFLQFEIPEFELVETMLFKKKFLYANDHVSRIHSSAEYFAFPFSRQSLKELMKEIAFELDPAKEYKVRILLDKKGRLRWEKTSLSPQGNGSNALRFSSEPVDEKNPFLFHKTTHRPWFNEAMRDISNGKCFDVVFCNLKGEITEGSISNIFIEKNKTLYTPPTSCGLLPGVLRKSLLRQGTCKEKVLYVNDILSANKVYCGNSVRGLVKVKVKKDILP